MGKRTTQLVEITTIDNNDILYGVDVSDLTHSPDGTSVRFNKGNLLKEVVQGISDNADDIGDIQGDIVEIETIQTTGWNPVTEVWAYASSTTITVPSGAVARYKKGMPFKLTANSVELQGYIVGVADTLLTVAGDPLTNHVFSNINVALAGEYPLGFKEWFDYTPTITGFSANPAGQFRFRVCGLTVTVAMRMISNGTSNSTSFTVSVPITSNSAIDIFETIPGIVNNGIIEGANQALLIANTAVVNMQRGASSTGWTNSGLKRITGLVITYQMA